MTATFKRGSTLAALLEFDADEWAAIWPWNNIAADAWQGVARQPLTVTPDVAAHTILLTADTSAWAPRLAQIDVRIARGGAVVYLPPASYMLVNIIAPATEAGA